MRFYENRGNLIVEENGKREILIVAKFMQQENQVKAADYLRSVAERLNKMEPFSDEMASYLQEIEIKVSDAAIAEKFLEDVAF